MRNLALILVVLLSLSGCKSSKGVASKKSKIDKNAELVITNSDQVGPNKADSLIASIIAYAKQFDGVNYKFGGNDNKGMDCSGLVTTAFKSENVLLPRTTSAMAAAGYWIDLNEVQKGDLLFFATQKNSRKVNHVGLVTDTRPGYVEFIHATVKEGVIISNMAERYWHFAYVQARRVL